MDFSSGFGLHAGENIPGSVTVKDKRCFDRLVNQIERKSTSEKFDVHQCRKCIFNSCWLGTRVLPDQRQYLTNLRSYWLFFETLLSKILYKFITTKAWCWIQSE